MRTIFSAMLLSAALISCSSGSNNGNNLSSPHLTLNWSIPEGSSGNAFLKDRLLFSGKTLRAMNLDKKRFAFKHTYRVSMFRQAYATDGTNTLIVTDDDGGETLRVVNDLGTVLNSIPLPGAGRTNIGQVGPFITENALYVSSGGTLSKYNRTDLLKPDIKPLWTRKYPGLQLGSIYALNDEQVFLAPNDDSNQVIALDGNGNERWVAQLAPKGTILATPYVMLPYKNTLIVEAGVDGLMALDMNTGKMVWDKPASIDICPTQGTTADEMTIADDKIFVGPTGGTCILAYHADTGKVAWVFDSPNHVTFGTKPIYQNGVVYATNSILFALDANTGKMLAQSKEYLGGNAGAAVVYDPVRNEILQWGFNGLYAYKPVK